MSENFSNTEINVKLNNNVIIKQHGTKSNQKYLERNPGNKWAARAKDTLVLRSFCHNSAKQKRKFTGIS